MSTNIGSISPFIMSVAFSCATSRLINGITQRVANQLFSLGKKRAEAQQLQEHLTVRVQAINACLQANAYEAPHIQAINKMLSQAPTEPLEAPTPNVYKKELTEYVQELTDQLQRRQDLISNATNEIKKIEPLYLPLAQSVQAIETTRKLTNTILYLLLVLNAHNVMTAAQNVFNWATAPALFDGLGALQILQSNATETQLAQIAQDLITRCATAQTASCLNGLNDTAPLCSQLKRHLHPDSKEERSIFKKAYGIILEMCPKGPSRASSEHLNTQETTTPTPL